MHQLIIICLAMIFTTVSANDTPAVSGKDAWTASLMFENDLFGNTDQNYTNGIKLTLISPDLTKFADTDKFRSWIDWWDNRIPFIYQGKPEGPVIKSIAISVGQNIYTPQDLQTTTLIKDDRPYAGWLYFGTAFHTKTPKRLDTVELQLGVVGSFSLAEEAQNFVHKVRDISTAKGWDNQLNNEPAFALIYEQKRRIRPENFYDHFGYDVIVNAGGALGTVYTYGNLGAETRLGWNIPADFGTSLIRPGGDTNAPVDSSDPRLARQGEFSAYVFAAVTGRVMLRDIFLDGNTFSSSHSIDKRYLVGDLILGASTILGGVKFSYAQVFRTREFIGQDHNQNFGSISMSFTF